jgi:hypothetical protein
MDAIETLTGLGQASRPDRFARDSGSKLHGLDRLGDNAAASNDRLVSNVCHDNAPGTDPAISTDGNLSRFSGLVANRSIQAIKRMGLGPGRNLHARSQQRVIADRYPTQLAIGSDVDMFAKSRIALGQQRPVPDKNRCVALAQHSGKKSRPQNYTQPTGQARQELTRSLNRCVGPQN